MGRYPRGDKPTIPQKDAKNPDKSAVCVSLEHAEIAPLRPGPEGGRESGLGRFPTHPASLYSPRRPLVVFEQFAAQKSGLRGRQFAYALLG